jgi:hypothetical protein
VLWTLSLILPVQQIKEAAAMAINHMERLYCSGESVPKDCAITQTFYKKSAELNPRKSKIKRNREDPDILYSIGQFYEENFRKILKTPRAY